MRVHSVKHGRHRTCRVSISALFLMTGIFLFRFALFKLGEKEKSVFAHHPQSLFMCSAMPTWRAAIVRHRSIKPRANRIPLLYPCYTFVLLLQGLRCRRFTAALALSPCSCRLFPRPVRHIYVTYHEAVKDDAPPVTRPMRM